MMSNVYLFFVFLCSYQLVNANLSKEPVSKLIVLGASPNSYGYLSRMKHNIINDCVQNGYNGQNDLEKTYDDLLKCTNKVTLSVDKRADFIRNLEDCSIEPVRKAKLCLKKEHSYYPDILLQITKAQINFICDQYETIKTQLIPCIKIFEKQEVRARFDKCFENVAGTLKDVSLIPASMDLFCQKYSPSLNCFAEILNTECKQYPKLQKFGEEYNTALNVPCTRNATKTSFS